MKLKIKQLNFRQPETKIIYKYANIAIYVVIGILFVIAFILMNR